MEVAQRRLQRHIGIERREAGVELRNAAEHLRSYVARHIVDTEIPVAKRTFDEILDKIEREAKAHGEEKDLARLRAHFRLGRRLAQRRLELGPSQQSLAARTGLQQAEISRIESGAGNPTFDTLETLSSGLNGRLEFRLVRRVARRTAAPKRRPKR